MKITKSFLEQIIKEEIEKVLNEYSGDPDASWWEKILGLDKPHLHLGSADIGGLGAAASAIRHGARTLRAAKKAKKLADQVKAIKSPKKPQKTPVSTPAGRSVKAAYGSQRASKALYAELSRFLDYYADFVKSVEKTLPTAPEGIKMSRVLMNRIKSKRTGLWDSFEIPEGFSHFIRKGDEPNVFILKIDSKLKEFFNISDDFKLVLSADTTGVAKNTKGVFDEMHISYKKIMTSTHSVRRSLQQEIDHLIKGRNPIALIRPNAAERIRYMLDRGEIIGHAKEAAYDLFKLYPTRSGKFSVSLLTRAPKPFVRDRLGISRESFWKYQRWQDYVNDPQKWIQDAVKKGLSHDEALKISKAGEEFLDYAEYFYQIFKAAP